MDAFRSSIADRAADFAGSGAKIRSSFVEGASDFTAKLHEKMPVPEALARALAGDSRSSGSMTNEAVQAPAMIALPRSSNTAQDRIKLDAMRKKLQETIAEREVLDKRLQELRCELRFCETSREGLVNLEVWLSQETADLEEALKPEPDGLTNLNDFLAPSKEKAPESVAPTQARAVRSASASRSRPVRTPRAASPQTSRGSITMPVPSLISSGHREPSLGPSLGSALRYPSMGRLDEWEDSIGKDVATCSFCGLKFPLDAEAIDRHSKECTGRQNRGRLAPEKVNAGYQGSGANRRSHSWTSTREVPDNVSRPVPELAARRPR